MRVNASDAGAISAAAAGAAHGAAATSAAGAGHRDIGPSHPPDRGGAGVPILATMLDNGCCGGAASAHGGDGPFFFAPASRKGPTNATSASATVV